MKRNSEKFNLSIIFIWIFLFFLVDCNSSNKNSDISTDSDVVPSDTLGLFKLSELIGNNVNAIPKLNGYTKRDTVLFGDENIFWKGMAYYNLKTTSDFILETNWQDSLTISRISIYSPSIKYKSIFVGSYFRNFKEMIDKKVPTAPDGYLFVKYRDIFYLQLDMSNITDQQNIYFGVNSIDEIPDSLKIEAIVIIK